MKALSALLTLAGLCVVPLAAAQDPVPNVKRRDAVVLAVEKVAPAVVNISTEVLIRNNFSRRQPMDFWDWFQGRRARPSERYVENSLGSGVIVDPSGYVLTNDHVIAAASRITVTLGDGRQFEAELVGSDAASDLAVLKLKGEGPWPAVAMGRSSDLMIGETVIAIGNPFGLQNSVSVGVVSATGRTLPGPDRDALPYSDFVQTDAAINPGNSGGALLNVLGELIGINAQIVASGQNLGFAIPIDRGRKVFDELVHYGVLRPAWTGAVVEDLDAAQAEYYNLDSTDGVLVVKLFGDSPAIAAGLRLGDVIIAVSSHPTKNIAAYDTAIAEVPYGERVNMRVIRRGEERTIPVRIEAFPEERAENFAWDVLGFTVAQRNGYVAIDRVRDGSRAADRGFVPGLGVAKINGKPVRTIGDFYGAIPQTLHRRTVNLVVRTRRRFYNVSLQVR